VHIPFWNVTEDFTLCEIIWTFKSGGPRKRKRKKIKWGRALPYTEETPHT
jgi:hypothetical protein